MRYRMGIMAVPKTAASVFREPNTNLLPNPEAFNAWATVTNLNVGTDAIANPEGVVNAETITDQNLGTTGAASVQSTAVTLTGPGVLYRYSVYFKPGTVPSLRLAASNFVSMAVSINFNGMTGAQEGTPGAQVIAYGTDAPINGWYRVWVTFNSVADLGGNFSIAMTSGAGSSTIMRDGTHTMGLWLAQLAAV